MSEPDNSFHRVRMYKIRLSMAMLSRLMAGVWQALDLRAGGSWKVGQMRAGQEHWHSQRVPPFGLTTGRTSLENNIKWRNGLQSRLTNPVMPWLRVVHKWPHIGFGPSSLSRIEAKKACPRKIIAPLGGPLKTWCFFYERPTILDNSIEKTLLFRKTTETSRSFLT